MARHRIRRLSRSTWYAACSVTLVAGATYAATQVVTPGPRANGTGLTPDGFLLTPTGSQLAVGAGPLAVALTPDGALALVENAGFNGHKLQVIDTQSLTVLQEFDGASNGSKGYYLGLAVARSGKAAYASDGHGSAIRVFSIAGKTLTEQTEIALPAGTWPAGIAISADETKLYVAGNLSDSLLVVDLATQAVEATIAVGHLPYHVLLIPAGDQAYVSNWGSHTVTRVDLRAGQKIDDVTVGAHPAALALNPGKPEIYVANTDSDDVSVLDAATGRLLRTIDLRPFPTAPVGASPDALAVSHDGETLYVGNAGDNDVAVVDLAGRGEPFDRMLGLIPTAWYPSGIAVTPDDRTLFVISMKGLGVGPVAPGQYIASQLRGMLSKIPVPSAADLRDDTRRAWNNFPTPTLGTSARDVLRIVPETPGGPTPIKHVIYIMKENQTFDAVFGDLGRGNGDPSLNLYPEDVTPNHHEIARRFATFDNFYANGEVSADGWTWIDAANGNTYNQKNWPLDYGNSGRLYDFGGFGNAETAAFPGTDTLRPFIWDRLADKGISYQNFGFFVNGAPVTVDSSMLGLLSTTDLAYPGWDLGTKDQVRVDEWEKQFKTMQANHEMPTVQFVYLPNDHTSGTSTGAPTPRAMLADNDLALGRVIDTLSHSEFWASTAVFVTEDDAQNDPDHVDGHRTIGLVVSPYTQTGRVDSTFYSGVSMLRTMELIVGIEPLTQFDALATPMRAAFTATPNFRPYDVLTPSVSLDELNGAAAPLSAQSAKLDFSRPDSADPKVLNAAIWQSIHGAASVPPAARVAMTQRKHAATDD
ncbi:MAG: bifunctional YncE family protein/alkaline phosphatase family protein [Polyangiaceae bacterium]|nr:bifunctional YncE family protein/alkaline phosphatase family protein [Polyangiaceae bacterium]